MRIVVLNGSPKGARSVTMQYVQYLETVFPEHEFVPIHVAARVGGLVKNPERFAAVITSVRSADAVLWAFPLYILLVCSQYKRFIELIRQNGVEHAFRGRYTAALSTSINFYDTTAHRYIHSVCDDLEMRYVGFHSANMHDLMKPEGRLRLEQFAQELADAVETRAEPPRTYAPVPDAPALDAPVPSEPKARTVDPYTRRISTGGRRIVILTDVQTGTEPIVPLVERLRGSFREKVTVVSLYDLDIRGGCQGCLRCGIDYRCVYAGKDGFIDFYNSVLKPADILVFAGTISARQLSWKWRQFFDRSFFNTHTPSLMGKQIAFLVAGPLSQLPDCRMVYEAWVEWQRSNLAGFLADEGGDRKLLEAQLDTLAERLVRLAQTGYIRPRTFLGIAADRHFRDDIWGGLRIVFPADHRAYRRLGVYDFPQKRVGRRLLVALGAWIMAIPPIRRRFQSTMKDHMLRPYRRILKRARERGGERGA